MGLCVPRGALFYAQVRRRTEVAFDESLRVRTSCLAEQLHKLLESGETPKASPSPKCESCSLKELCMPELATHETGVWQYVRQEIERGKSGL